MEIKEIKKREALDKIIKIRITMFLNRPELLKNLLETGFGGYHNYNNHYLELSLRDCFDDSVIWKII